VYQQKSSLYLHKSLIVLQMTHPRHTDITVISHVDTHERESE